MDGTLTGTITQGQSGSGSNGRSPELEPYYLIQLVSYLGYPIF